MTATNVLTLGVNWPSIITGFLLVLFLLSCVFLILVVLIQKPQGGGLTGAFGSGAGSGQTAFGARTGDALTVATIGFFVFYLLSAVGLSYFMKPQAAPVATPQVVSEQAPADGSTSAPMTTPAEMPAQMPAQMPKDAPVDGAPKSDATTPATTPPFAPVPVPVPVPAPAEPGATPKG